MRGVQGSGGGGRYYRPRDGTRGGRGVGWPEARTQVHAQGHHVFRIESGGLVGEAAIRMARLRRGSGHQSALALVQVIPRPPGVSVRVSSASLRASPTTLCWALTLKLGMSLQRCKCGRLCCCMVFRACIYRLSIHVTLVSTWDTVLYPMPTCLLVLCDPRFLVTFCSRCHSLQCGESSSPALPKMSQQASCLQDTRVVYSLDLSQQANLDWFTYNNLLRDSKIAVTPIML